MRRLLRYLTLLIICVALLGCQPKVVDSFGRPIQMSAYSGKWVVIHYWATWCSPCIGEIPELIKLKTYYPKQVVVLGVNIDHLDNAVLRELAGDYRVNYPLLREFPIEHWASKPPSTLPVTYIISPKGELYQTLLGPQKFENFQAVMNLPPITYN